MKIKTKWEKVLITGTLLLGILTMGGSTSQAALQANPTTHNSPRTASGATWITSIRDMEKSGQTMGLTETINESTLLATSASNNIDVHMMRTTEYGAVAILSASGFGYSGKLADAPVKSTTGNVTGVYFTGKGSEWTAGVIADSTVGKDKRYYDLYTSARTSAKVGDALGLDTYTTNPGCTTYQTADRVVSWQIGIAVWIADSGCGFFRDYNGIFSFAGNGQWSSYTLSGRGVAVVKSGI